MENKLIPSIIRLFCNSLSFPVFSIILTFSLFVSTAMAQSWYVKPSSEIPIRRGQGTDYKILAIVPDGTEVNIIEENAPWVKVVTQEGKEGWVLKRYLSQEKPLHEVVTILQRKNTDLEEVQAVVSTRNDELTSRNIKLQQDLDNCIVDLTETQQQYQTLVQDTADVILIKENLTKNRGAVVKLQKELSAVSQENKQLKSSQDIKWFLTGGATLIFGCIVGMIFSRSSRKKKSSLY
jgi:SH3 domain protein